MTSQLRRVLLLFVFMAFAGGHGFAQSFKSEFELRKQAERDFKKEDYAAALPLYSQLLSLNQKDPVLNYRYGVCLLMADKDKTSAFNYLEFSSRDEKTPDDVVFYIGKALQLKYSFDEAISAYKDYQKTVGASVAKKFDTERQIETCKNAKELMKSRVNVTVKGSKEVSKNAVYGLYELAAPGGKFLATPDKFMTGIDKRRIMAPVMFLTANGQTIYFTSYGKNENNGKDIYVVRKLSSGEWGMPQSLGSVVNTAYDEDYPYLDADGKTLYFSSKGHNSMGGYDMFKTTFNPYEGTWSQPVNLGAGINSPDDDFFYMPVSDGVAQYASAKEADKGAVMVYTIEVAASQKVMAVVHGKYKSTDQMRADGKISVLRRSDHGLVATSRTDQKTGAYELSIPTGDDYEIVVEGGGYMAHVENFSLPKMDQPVTIAQQVSMSRDNGAEALEIRNQFVQSDGAAVASSAMPEESQVIRSEYTADEMNKQKLQPFTIDGKVVYATAPASKNAEASSNEKKVAVADSVAVKSSGVSKEQADARQAVNKEVQRTADKAVNEDRKTTPAVTQAAEAKAAEEGKAGEIKNVEDAKAVTSGSQPVVAASAAERKSAEKKNNEAGKEIVSEIKGVKKETTVSSSKSAKSKDDAYEDESVSIAFDDAEELKEEAKEIVAEAKVSSAVGSTKDSLAKLQLKQMADALKAGDEGAARDLSRLSQLNADTAQAARVQAHELDNKAKAKQSEADKAQADAKELQKNTKKNANAMAALREPKVDKKKEVNKDEKKNADKQAEVQANEAAAGKVVSNDAAADKNINASGVQQDKEAVKQNTTGEVKTSLSPALSKGEGDSLPSGGKGWATSSGSVNLAESKTGVSASTPATSDEATKRAETLKEQSKDFKLQSEALKEQANNASDKELKKELKKGADSYADSSKAKSKEADKTLALAKDLKKQEEKSAVSATAVAGASTEKKKAAEQTVAEKAVEQKKEEKNAVPAVEVAKASTEKKKQTEQTLAEKTAEQKREIQKDIPAAKDQKATAPGEHIAIESSSKTPQAGKANAEKETKPAEAKAIEPSSKEINAEKEKANNTAVAKPERARQAEVAAASTDQPASAQLLRDVSPEAISTYKEYIKTRHESDEQAKQANDLQAQVETMPASPERDRLIQQSNDLNVQSIKTWQAAQVKLNEVKEMDPAAEAKLSKAFPPLPVSEKKTTYTEAANTKRQQKDSLMSQAVTHREMAEHAADTVTEKTELKRTQQLIVASANSGKKESTKQHAPNKQAGNEAANTPTNAKSNEVTKSLTDQPITPAGEKTVAKGESKTIAFNEKESLAKQGNAAGKISGNDAASSKEAANKSATKENGNAKISPEGESAGITASTVLDAKTLHVDEDAIYTVSPMPVYTEANPVPMNPPLPDGLVFKVQIGAFHNPLSADAFKNVQPLSGETTRPGWIRYCVGLFRTFEPANMVKMEMRAGGYKDAFVVAYYNGKRISLYDSYSIINRSGSREKELYAVAAEKETHHLSSMNIKSSDYPSNNDEDASSFYGTSSAPPNTDESAVEYAVQVGVYKTNVVPKKLQSLIPLNAESYKTNLYRFTTGRFSIRSAADSMRLVAVNAGVRDAFVVIYKGSRRAGESYAGVTSGTTNVASVSASTTQAIPTGHEIVFKVQIGAYRTPFSEEKLAELRTKHSVGLSQSQTPSGLYLLYAGSFPDYHAALLYKNYLLVNGTADAFIVAFSGDIKISLQKALLQGGK